MHAHAMTGRWGAESAPGHFDPRALAHWLAMTGHRGGHRGRPHRRPTGATASGRRSAPASAAGRGRAEATSAPPCSSCSPRSRATATG